MGSYIFRECSLGALECEEDLNSAKYISTKADYLEFSVNNYDTEKGNYLKDYFKYISKKFKFTDRLNKIKVTVKKRVLDMDVKEVLLDIQKHVNKFMFAKKFRKLPSWQHYWRDDNNLPDKPELRDQDFSIKVEFDDAKYRIKKIKYQKEKCPQINYFGLFALSKKYDLKTIVDFYSNLDCQNYDFLLPIHCLPANLLYMYEYAHFFCEQHHVNNLQFPPIPLDFDIDKEFMDQGYKSSNRDKVMKLLIFDKILSLQSSHQVQFFDIGFVVFISEPVQLCRYIEYFNSKLEDIDNFILRIYVSTDHFTDKKLLLRLFLKSAIKFKNRQNSRIILYLFNHQIYSMALKSEINPFAAESVLSHFPINQIQNNQKKLALLPYMISRYTMKFDIPFMSIVYSTFSSHKLMKKLKKKTILYRILLNIGVCPKESHFNAERAAFQKDINSHTFNNNESQMYFYNNNVSQQGLAQPVDRTARKYLIRKILSLSKEYVIPFNVFPKKQSQVHENLVHFNFDYVFNLMPVERPILNK